MTTHMTKTWFDGKNIITQEIPESEIYKPSMTKDEAQTLEALKYAASKGYGRDLLNMISAPFTIKEALAQPPQEPVAKYSDIVSDGGLDPRNKFDLPPQRPWIGLNEDELNLIWLNCHGNCCLADGRILNYERAIEAKLKEKNT